MSWSGLPDFIEDKIIPEPMSGCWLWIGGLRDKKDQYGGVQYAGKMWRSHRLVYTLLRHEVPAILAIDHDCRNKFCCNPDHLTPRTWKENIHRGVGVAPKNLAKTHCPQGHAYNAENTYVWKDQRFCRTCSAGYKRNYEQRVGKFRVRKK
jgi:HNH endonuclease